MLIRDPTIIDFQMWTLHWKKNRQQPNAGDSVRHEMKWYTDEFFVVSVDSIAQGRWRVGISP